MTYLKQRDSTRAPRRLAPAGACDCHAHVFGNAAQYPFVAERSYTPPEAPVEQYRSMLQTLGIQRGVIVQPSVYGNDNSCTLDAAARFGAANARAVVMFDASVTDKQLEEFHRRGARGVRFNAMSKGRAPIEDMEEIAARIAPLGWHIQTYATPALLRELRPTILRLPVHLVIDHMGQVSADAPADHPDVMLLLDLLKSGQTWVKLSAYRISVKGHPYTDATMLAKAMLKAAPDRCIWGSDWSHPALEQYMPDDGDLFDLLCDWVEDDAQLDRVLRANPARLYGFT